MQTNHCYRIILIGAILIAGVLTANGQEAGRQQDRTQTKAWVGNYLRYLKLDGKASPAEVDQLTDLRIKMLARPATLEERQAAVKDFTTIMLRLWGNNPFTTEQQFTQFSFNFGRLINWLVLDKDSKPASSSFTQLGQPGLIDKKGRGPIPMILIADLRMGPEMYQGFMERNGERYTMYAVSLPGFWGTPPPPPIPFDGKTTPWWDGAEQAIVNLIDKERLQKPAVVGTQASAYLAARLALDHPDKVRAAILIDGNVYQPLPPPTDPDKRISVEERPLALAKMPNAYGMFAELIPPVLPSRADMEERIKVVPINQVSTFFYMRDVERAKALAISAGMGADPRAYRYGNELLTTDLTAGLKNIKVPTLALPAIPDDGSPGQGSATVSQWEEIKIRYPSIPLVVLPFENSRSYITEEAPRDLDRVIEGFLAGKTVEIRREIDAAARPSPKARVSQMIGATEVSIAYGRPALKGRKLGEPFPQFQSARVWRTGANEATTIRFATDVMIEGQKLAAGTYSLFSIPGETEWTLIFNKIATQWGAFNYNSEFDALRVKVKPQESEHQECLSFDFDILSASSAQAVLKVGKARVPFKIEVTEVKTP